MLTVLKVRKVPVAITDAHIHIQPFEMMPPAVAATFWKGKPNRAELEGYAADPRSCSRAWTPTASSASA